jgi:hypothetical protein
MTKNSTISTVTKNDSKMTTVKNLEMVAIHLCKQLKFFSAEAT